MSVDFVSSLRDGVPPYRMGSKKQLQREMHRSVKANGQVSLPHFPVSLDGTGSAVSSVLTHGKSWEVESSLPEIGWGKGRERNYWSGKLM